MHELVEVETDAAPVRKLCELSVSEPPWTPVARAWNVGRD